MANHSFKLKVFRDAIAEGAIPTLPEDALLIPPGIRRRALIDSVNDVRVNYALRVALPGNVPVQVMCDESGVTVFVVMSNGMVYSAGGDYAHFALGDGSSDYGVAFSDVRTVDYSGRLVTVSTYLRSPLAMTEGGQLMWWSDTSATGNYAINSLGYDAWNGVTHPAVEPFSSLTPENGVTNITFQSISNGHWVACGIDTDGDLWTWGYGGIGTLGRGLGSTWDRLPTPGLVPHPEGGSRYWVFCHSGRLAMCAIDDLGQLWCWGDNSYGMCGVGVDDDVAGWFDTPQKVGADTDWVKCQTSENRTIAIKTDGSIWGWGFNDEDYWLNHETNDPLCGADEYYPPWGACFHWSPLKISGDHVFTDFGEGFYHVIALKADGSAWGMGSDYGDGCLGLGSGIDFVTDWTEITEGDWLEFTSVFCHYGVTMAIGTDKKVYLWGYFYGDGDSLDRWYPTRWQLPHELE